MDKYLLVLLGGAVGSLARYLTAAAIMSRYHGRFPFGTVIVNVSGCFLIGVIATLLARTEFHPNWHLLLVVGFLGGFTTFSSFAWETYVATRQGNMAIGFLNVAASVTLGYLAVWLGVIAASRH